jgi:hypothetical protein
VQIIKPDPDRGGILERHIRVETAAVLNIEQV